MKSARRSWGAGFIALGILAWTAGASPLHAQSIQVTAANPNNATEGTINLNVIVNGSGFKKGAKAQWFESGTVNPGDVTVNSTAFNSSSQLTANISVSTSGFTGSYDIQVTNTDGRSGKGTGLFAVIKGSGSSPSCNSFNVTTIINDADSTNTKFQIQSDGLGPYTAYSSGKRNFLTSQIDANCAWSFDTTSSTTRGFAVTLAYPDPSGSTPLFTGPLVLKGRINTHCATNTVNNGTDVGNMTFAGQTAICPVNVAFYYNSVWYNVGINPFNWPGTTMAQVTCTGVSGGQCNQWTIVPNPADSFLNPSTNQLSSLGELTLPPCFGCGGGTPLGLYYLSYSFLIHK